MPGRPARFNDYSERLQIVPDVWSFPDAVEKIEFDFGKFIIEVTNSDNPLLDDADYASDFLAGDTQNGDHDVEKEISDQGQEGWSVVPIDYAERRLVATINSTAVDGNDPQYAYDIGKCDFCGCELAERGVFVDGCVRGQTVWGNMCAQCFGNKDEGIGWQSDQLYAREQNGD